MKKFTRILTRVLIALVVLVVVVGAFGTYYVKSHIPNRVAQKSFPQIDGEINISGLDAPVDIYRDEMGIPHIYAASLHDLFFAQGYVHAQDRFWQMDFWRHIGSGRLSEMFGEGQIETDQFLRTMGWRQTAEAEYAQLSPTSKAILDAYTEGVNAYIGEREAIELSLEYLILTGVLNPDYVIEPWTPIHSLTWGKAMSWDLRGNMDDEITRVYLLKTMTPEQVAEIYPEYPEDFPVIVNNIGEGMSSSPVQPSPFVDIPESVLDAAQHNASLLEPLLGPAFDGIGSNSWAISGKLTNTGMPLLANDPHLGIQMPSIWYQVGLHCTPKSADCPFEVAGFSFAGVPGVVIGHNENIAWGFTNTGPDVMDLYIEKINPENPNQYEVNGEWVDFETRQETIHVAGGEPVTITVRTSRHGPIISDVYGSIKDNLDPKDKEAKPFREKAGIDLPQHYAIAVAWTALEPSTPFEAIWGFNKAENWEQFREASRSFHVPAQNLIYADRAGNIGYQMPGDIPIRAKGDGTLPVPGWTDEYEWTGYIPFEELPYAFNPAEGYIVTANNRVPPRNYPYLITKDWDYGFRANRIVDMIESTPGKIDIAYMRQMQGDSYNMNAETLVPILLATNLDPELASVRDQLLRDWDYQNTIDSPSAALFEAFWKHLQQNTFVDEMPPAFWEKPTSRTFWRSSRFYEIARNIAAQPNSAWWDDKSTPEIETREEIFQKSFAEAVAELEKTLGKNPANWRWGDLHVANFENATLGQSGIGPIEAMFNRGPFPTSGGSNLVNATGWNPNEGFHLDWLPSMRMIVDMSDLNNSLTVHTTGNSGHAYHPHYMDMAPLWANVQYYPMLWDKDSIISNAEGLLRLKP
ncbi:MAG: penicillin acylase family protein [Anaerolineales bacterium]